ncbi:MAG TPA: carbon starvation CstA family protein [Candidatus Binatia bacterium]|jgi:carbon starvation protein|nr:carbon starvation CstA family protein [Candidatus Binatia bacterium]
MKKAAACIFWFLLALLGAWAYATLAFHRGEHLNSAFILIAALCSYAIGYRFYSKWIATRVLLLDDRRATPCEVHDDGKDFVKTNKWIVFGHHFAAISGPGPLVGPVLAAQFGYLPGTLWILIGVTLGGAVQDFVVLFCSMRRDGKSLGQMVREELNAPAGFIALVAILAIIIILLAVLALVVVKALAESPWGIFTVGATIPTAMFMGGYLRFWRVGKVMEASAIGVVCLLLAVWGGKVVHVNPALAAFFTLRDINVAWAIICYGLAASVLPVWLLLAPRDYLSTFMKLGTIFALALGIFLVLPTLRMPAVSRFVDGSGLVVAGKLFPFCFITIACGAISGFHTLISSGTTPKLITRESYARPIGYGAMCLESLVAIMALIAACTLDPGVYLGMNVKGDPPATVARVTSLGFPVTEEHMTQLANQIGEKTLFGRTGGAATLAVGMAQIFSKAVSGRWLDLWYHFAIMFEALFILTTIDAGTRVGRYLLQDVLGHIWKPLGQTRNIRANVLASLLMVGGWGYFLIQGVRDPLGGINSLWPLFGIANQMLASIALCLVTTIVLKMMLHRMASVPTVPEGDSTARLAGDKRALPALALITLVPLVWLLAVTMTAGVEKICHPDPRIGFLAQARVLNAKWSGLEQAVSVARSSGTAQAIQSAEQALHTNRVLHFNNLLDAFVAAAFLVLVSAIVLLSVREWVLLLARRKLTVLCESEPVWLPDYAVAEARPLHLASLVALAFALAKELSGEAQLERADREAQLCQCGDESVAQSAALPAGLQARTLEQQRYLEVTERRFNGVRRCC